MPPPENHLRQVSGMHCIVTSDFRMHPPRVEVEDLSMNGTFLDDVKLTKAKSLSSSQPLACLLLDGC